MQISRRFQQSASLLEQHPHKSCRDTSPRLRQLLALLAQQKIIRCYIDGTKNLGHQASSVNLILRLIDELSYRHHIEVLYTENNKASLGVTSEKIASLLPGLSLLPNGKLLGNYRETTLSFTPLDPLCWDLPRVLFGFSGGADRMDINYARKLHVEYFLRLQPYLWDDLEEEKINPFFVASRLETFEGPHLYLCDAWPPFRNLPIKISTAYNKPYGDMGCNAADPPNTEPLHTQTLIWPVYGLHHFSCSAGGIAIRLGLCAALLGHELSCRIKLIFCCPIAQNIKWQRATASRIQQLLNDQHIWYYLRSNCTESDAISLLSTADSLIDEQGLTHSIEYGGGAVEILFPGPLPPHQFQQLLAKSRLPAVLEGLASLNEAVQINCPFIQLLRPEYYSKSLYNQMSNEKSMRELSEEMTRCTQALLDGPFVTEEQTLGVQDIRAIVSLYHIARDLLTPASQYCELFEQHSAWAASESRDKLMLGLLALANLVYDQANIT